MKKIIKLITIALSAALTGCSSTDQIDSLRSLNCNDHVQLDKEINRFAIASFDGRYKNSAIEAQAQLFLIEEKGPGDYSKKFNIAEEKYRINKLAAQKKGCKTDGYADSPISEFRNRANLVLEEYKKKQGSK